MEQQRVCDFKKLDNPVVLASIFHPQKDRSSVPPAGALDYYVTAADGIRIGCRFYIKDAQAPSILFFHGNGEIVSDYDDIGPVYNSCGLNLLAVDYRGYGKSNGAPTVTAMLRDAPVILKEVRQWLQEKGMKGPLWVMGRSLGSVSAIELASQHEADLSGMIIESGFAYTVPLLDFLGVNTRALGITEADCFGHITKIAKVRVPTLIIHAQYDQFIPVSDAEALLKHSPAQKKQLMVVPGADHNSVIMMAGKSYFETIRQFITRQGE
jgi:alpha-beta hydrolase superfamily lysophospholipase